jgi:hypothetical protein
LVISSEQAKELLRMLLTYLNSLVATGVIAPEVYIDPNTGGMLFQVLAVLLATLSGILFFFSRQIKAGWARIRRNLRKEKPSQDPDEKPG